MNQTRKPGSTGVPAAIAALDRDDPLADRRDHFVLPDGIYLDGNSLGPMPATVAARLRHCVEQEWARGLVGSWNTAGWIDLPHRVAERLAPLLIADKAGEEIEEDFSDAGGRALVIGLGRFGQVVTQALRLRDISVTILDADAERVREAREFGSCIHCGDGMRREVLRAAGAEDADVIVVCVDDAAVAKDIVNMVQSKFPQAELLVRAYDRTAAIDLIHMGIEEPVRETFESGLRMGRAALRAAGVAGDDAAETIDDVRRRDESRLHLQV